MTKFIYIPVTLSLFITSCLAQPLLSDELNSQQVKSWGELSSPPSNNAETGTFFSGDECNSGTTAPPSIPNESQSTKCYITHFPSSDITTKMQSSDDGDIGFSFSWDLD
ncbi:hypothetical protein [Vibrio sp. Vb339]|uniref:hypothetical protein n=1 Tax=Vibrio sp. Vb339 TaxID=1192013 RepID=UPI001552BDAA|nr:hypothetical protein [Vibrio sp. Vb339]